MTFKKIIRNIHLVIGFAAGAVVLLSMTAAAIFTWDKELTDWYYQDAVFVRDHQREALDLTQLWEMAQQHVPGRTLSDVSIYKDPARSFEFSGYKDSDGSGIFWWDEYEYWEKVYVDQYSGEVLGYVNMKSNWIYNTRMLHQYLLLRWDIGHWIVGYATLFVIVLVVTGLVLWWPKSWKVLKQRLKIKWNARWRRVNFDIHAVGGFYSYLLILILAITGLVWTFDWWTNGIYRILGNDPDQVWEKREPLVLDKFPDSVPLDRILADLQSKRETWEELSIFYPYNREKSAEIGTYLKFDGDTGWDEWDSYFYHPASGELLASNLQENKTLGAKWRNSNYAIHVGSIYGLPTKIMACAAALFLASLPVTGFLLWWGRKRKPVKQTTPRKQKLGVIRPKLSDFN
jgi:uncharacterized iron-regulated membrane protein